MTNLLPRVGKPNFLVILGDDIGTLFYRHYDRINPYRGDGVNPANTALDPNGTNLYAHTPVLDRLIRRGGVVFENAYEQPVCSSARMATYLGTHPSTTQLGGVVDSTRDLEQIAATRDTWFRVMSNAGWLTQIAGKWHLHHYAGGEFDANLADWARFPIDGGMDDYACTFHNLSASEGPRPGGGPSGDNYSYYLNRNGTILTFQSPQGGGGGGEDDHVAADFSLEIQFQEVERFIAASGGRPWLSVLSTNVGHDPNNQPLPTSKVHTAEHLATNTNSWRNHVACLEWLDTRLGEMLDAMDPAVRARTVIIFTSDNGGTEGLLDIAAGEKTLGTTLDLLRNDHDGTNRLKNSVFEHAARVPLIFSGPGIAKSMRGKYTPALIQSCDLYPTVLGMAGVTVPTAIDGIDQGPVLRGEQAEVRDEIVLQRFTPNVDPTTITDAPGVNGTRNDWSLSKRFTGDANPLLNGRFKVDAEYTGFDGSQQFTHRLYRLEDGDGELDDPNELTRLDGDSTYDTIKASIIARHDAHLAGTA